jgi:hypothetical protein
MKRILTTLALVILAGSFSFALEPVTVTIDSVSSTTTVRGLDISSHTATNVVVSTAPLYRQVCIQNLSTTDWVACGDNVAVSTITTHNLMGVIVPAPATIATATTPMCFSIVAGNSFYCRTSSVTATSRVVVIRGR